MQVNALLRSYYWYQQIFADSALPGTTRVVVETRMHDIMKRVPAELLDLRGHRLKVLHLATGDDDVGAGAGELDRDGSADADTPARHNGDLVLDREWRDRSR